MQTSTFNRILKTKEDFRVLNSKTSIIPDPYATIGSYNNLWRRMQRRVLDLAISSIVILGILSWLTPVFYVLIKLESHGPIFYRHLRHGKGFKEFHCYKFRTLKFAEDDPHPVFQGDPRVTRLGVFLRKTSLDELPQFFNVFLGDMSLVGPRPHMPKFTEEYRKKVDPVPFMLRHLVKPGITGLAQIRGYRGEIEHDSDIINRIRLDIFYLENWSLLLDFKIIYLTAVKMLLGDEKAY